MYRNIRFDQVMSVIKRALLLDGYVDEPACFGVPPYISPYVRYLYGVLITHGFDVNYVTADEWRHLPHGEAVAEADVITVIAGLTVPGRYRGGSPLTLREIRELCKLPRQGPLFIGGPVRHGYTLRGGSRAMDLIEPGVDCLCTGDPEAVLDHFLRTGEYDPARKRSYEDLRSWALPGAEVVKSHPSYPWLIAELELSRGCERKNGHCSFCSEGIHSSYEERKAADIAEEAKGLARAGIRAFRFGRCSNILSWGGTETPSGFRPSARNLEELYAGVHNACDDLEVLHTDNCNPSTLVTFPDDSFAALEVISRWNTEGDVLSLGIENLDPKVLKLNNLKVDEEGALQAVRIINEAGSWRKRKRGLPSVLPGLNFLAGLAGEDADAFETNRRFLERLLAEDLIVRRINIRQVMLFQRTPLAGLLEEFPSRVRKKNFLKWKNWVREEIDPIMMRRVAPVGTVLKRVRLEEKRGNRYFGRSLGSYPILAGIAASRKLESDVIDVLVTDHGSRSVTGIPSPVDMNQCSPEELEALPGIGKARARRIIQSRPYFHFEDLEAALDETRLLDGLRGLFLFRES